VSIWQYREISNQLDGHKLSLGEGNTPFETINLKSFQILLKREDLNPTNSWKDRMVAFKISRLKTNGIKNAVISTSGNAGISFLTYANKLYPELCLDIIISDKNIPPVKEEKITKLVSRTHHNIHKTKFAKKLRSQITYSKNAALLSSAFDDDSLIGYWSLGFEIAQIINKLQKSLPLFLPASSGAGVVGIVQGIEMKLKNMQLFPKIIVCQTQSVHPLLHNLPIDKKKSLADAITDKSMYRSYQVLKIVNSTEGQIYAITNQELLKLKKTFKALSYTSLLSIAGAFRFYESNKFDTAICIASGL
jgi:threonine synthase